MAKKKPSVQNGRLAERERLPWFELDKTAVLHLQKKAEHLPELSETLIEPDTNDANATILELDELWSFVLKKVNTSWIWIALCRKTRQVVSYAIGDRSKETCQKLWDTIPLAYRTGKCFTDFYSAYKSIIP